MGSDREFWIYGALIAAPCFLLGLTGGSVIAGTTTLVAAFKSGARCPASLTMPKPLATDPRAILQATRPEAARIEWHAGIAPGTPTRLVTIRNNDPIAGYRVNVSLEGVGALNTVDAWLGPLQMTQFLLPERSYRISTHPMEGPGDISSAPVDVDEEGHPTISIDGRGVIHLPEPATPTEEGR